MVTTSRVVAEYEYHDLDGSLLYVVERRDPKTFRQRRPGPYPGTWTWSLGDAPRVPFRYPAIRREIAHGSTIIVVEGEKDVLALVGHRFASTTNAGGSSWKWTAAFVEMLGGGRRYAVIVDSDTPGRQAAAARAQLLREHADDVRIIDLAPERSDGFDVTDWFAEGHSADELRAIIDAAPIISLERRPAPLSQALPRELSTARMARSLKVVSADEIALVRPEWLERGRIPLGTLTIFDGQGGVGKTSFALQIIANATVGRATFGDCDRPPRNALIIADEDDLGVLRAKLAVAGADLRRVKIVDGTVLVDIVEALRLPRDVSALRELIETESAAIAYIDALYSHLDLEGEGRMAHQMRAGISPLARLARETGAAIIATRHWSKGTKAAMDRGLGSGELTNVARSVLSFGRHPAAEEGEDRFVVAVTKSNWAAREPGIEYRLESVELLDDNGAPWSIPRVRIVGVASDVTADDLAMNAPTDRTERGKMIEAQEAIIEALAGRPLLAAELEAAVRANHIADVTFRRARSDLRTSGRIRREGGGAAGPVRWSLCEIDSGSPIAAPSHSLIEKDLSESKSGAAPHDDPLADLVASRSREVTV